MNKKNRAKISTLCLLAWVNKYMCLWLVYMLDYTSITLVGGGGVTSYIRMIGMIIPGVSPPGIYKLVYSTLHSHAFDCCSHKESFYWYSKSAKKLWFFFSFCFFQTDRPFKFWKNPFSQKLNWSSLIMHSNFSWPRLPKDEQLEIAHTNIPGVACPWTWCWGSSLLPGSPRQPTNSSIGILYTPGTDNDINGFTILPSPEFYTIKKIKNSYYKLHSLSLLNVKYHTDVWFFLHFYHYQ